MDEIHEPRSVERQEQISIHQVGDHKHSTQVVDDLNASRRLSVSRVANLIWLFFVILEALIGFRIVFKLIAANPNNPLANLVYTITDLLLWPFSGLTVTPSMQDIVLDIPAIIAMFVYALLGWVLVKLVWLFFYWPASRKVRIIHNDHDHSPD